MITEEQLIKGLKRGDDGYFDILIQRYQRMVFSLAYNYTYNVEDAEDITQEVFLSVFKGIKKFRGESNLKTWLYRITINACSRYNRKRKFRSILSLNFLDKTGKEQTYEIEDPITPEHSMLQRERQSLLKRAIKGLPERQRQVFLLKHKEGLKISEIAEVLGCPQGTVKANLFKAIRNLKNSMEDIK